MVCVLCCFVFVCVGLMCLYALCGRLCDAVWFVVERLIVRGAVLNICVCVFCLGVFVCCCRVWCMFVLLGGVNVFECFECELLCAVVWCNLFVVRVCARCFICLRVLRVICCVVL